MIANRQFEIMLESFVAVNFPEILLPIVSNLNILPYTQSANIKLVLSIVNNNIGYLNPPIQHFVYVLCNLV